MEEGEDVTGHALKGSEKHGVFKSTGVLMKHTAGVGHVRDVYKG